MHLIPPNGRTLKWNIRFVNHDGKPKKFPGDRDQAIAMRIGVRIDMLVKAKRNGDPPPFEIKLWLDNLSDAHGQRLIELGLLEIQHKHRDLPLIDQVPLFEKVVASRMTNTAVHAKVQASRVRKVIEIINATTLAGLTEDEVNATVLGMGRSVTTRRHYLIALKDFAKWMVKSKRARENPLIDIKLPRKDSNPEVERVPLSFPQFEKLLAYLRSAPPHYPRQRNQWTAKDRALIYWTAVRTAYRQNELRSLRVWNVRLDASPVQITLGAANTKNGVKASVPIEDELAEALREHIKERDPSDRLFDLPKAKSIVETFHRDLDGAGIQWNFGEDSPYTIDFHTLRSTAICWWLEVNGLKQKKVQILARLLTMDLVQTYSRNLPLDEYGWLSKGPKLTG